MTEVSEKQRGWLGDIGVTDVEIRKLNKEMATAILSVYFSARPLLPESRAVLKELVVRVLDNLNRG